MVASRSAHRFVALAAVSAATIFTNVIDRSALAAAPACFSERTVSESITLRDDHLRVFGGLRAGQVVHVRDELDGGKWADVEIADPVGLTGRTDGRKLVVFARADIETQPGLAWLMAGAPLEIVSGDGERARVVVALMHDEKPQLPAIEVSCALLQGTAPPEIIGWDVVGPRHREMRTVRGRPVEWDGTRQLESDDGARSVPLRGGARMWDTRRVASILSRREGERALVEVVDRYNWTRHRGWTSADGLRFRYKKVPDVICGCAEGGAWLVLTWPSVPRARLQEPVSLRSISDDRPLVTLPAADSLIPLHVGDEQSLVIWTAPDGPGIGPSPQQVIFGRVPTRAMAPLSASKVNAVIEGKIHPSTSGAPSPRSIVVRARYDLGDVPLGEQVPVAPDGSFRVIAPVNRSYVSVWAEGSDGAELSRHESVKARPGQTARVDLILNE